MLYKQRAIRQRAIRQRDLTTVTVYRDVFTNRLQGANNARVVGFRRLHNTRQCKASALKTRLEQAIQGIQGQMGMCGLPLDHHEVHQCVTE